MGFVFDIKEEFQALFGVRAEAFDLADSRRNRTSKGVSLKKQDGRTGHWYFMPVTLGGLELWNPIVRLTARKTVVETRLVERKGSVKEIISQDDYVINIRGIIKRADGAWPDTEVQELETLWSRDEALDIDCAITSIFLHEGEKVVLTNFTMPEMPGQTEAVAYELEMVSDIPFELELEEEV